jgi:hypothetical protein
VNVTIERECDAELAWKLLAEGSPMKATMRQRWQAVRLIGVRRVLVAVLVSLGIFRAPAVLYCPGCGSFRTRRVPRARRHAERCQGYQTRAGRRRVEAAAREQGTVRL